MKVTFFSVKTEWLDGRHVVFGQIVDGMDVVKKVTLPLDEICCLYSHNFLFPRLRVWAPGLGKPAEKL